MAIKQCLQHAFCAAILAVSTMVWADAEDRLVVCDRKIDGQKIWLTAGYEGLISETMVESSEDEVQAICGENYHIYDLRQLYKERYSMAHGPSHCAVVPPKGEVCKDKDLYVDKERVPHPDE